MFRAAPGGSALDVLVVRHADGTIGSTEWFACWQAGIGDVDVYLTTGVGVSAERTLVCARLMRVGADAEPARFIGPSAGSERLRPPEALLASAFRAGLFAHGRAQLEFVPAAAADAAAADGEHGLRGTIACSLYMWAGSVPVCVCDIDGTITRSDIGGHVASFVHFSYAHAGVCTLLAALVARGYAVAYVTARPLTGAVGIGRTRHLLFEITKDPDSPCRPPLGPIFTTTLGTLAALRDELSGDAKAGKVARMQAIATLFAAGPAAASAAPPPTTPPLRGAGGLYCGFGNRAKDVHAYRAVGIADSRIFHVSPQGAVRLVSECAWHEFEAASGGASPMRRPRRGSGGVATAATRSPSAFDPRSWRQAGGDGAGAAPAARASDSASPLRAARLSPTSLVRSASLDKGAQPRTPAPCTVGASAHALLNAGSAARTADPPPAGGGAADGADAAEASGRATAACRAASDGDGGLECSRSEPALSRFDSQEEAVAMQPQPPQQPQQLQLQQQQLQQQQQQQLEHQQMQQQPQAQQQVQQAQPQQQQQRVALDVRPGALHIARGDDDGGVGEHAAADGRAELAAHRGGTDAGAASGRGRGGVDSAPLAPGASLALPLAQPPADANGATPSHPRPSHCRPPRTGPLSRSSDGDARLAAAASDGAGSCRHVRQSLDELVNPPQTDGRGGRGGGRSGGRDGGVRGTPPRSTSPAGISASSAAAQPGLRSGVSSFLSFREPSVLEGIFPLRLALGDHLALSERLGVPEAMRSAAAARGALGLDEPLRSPGVVGSPAALAAASCGGAHGAHACASVDSLNLMMARMQHVHPQQQTQPPHHHHSHVAAEDGGAVCHSFTADELHPLPWQ